ICLVDLDRFKEVNDEFGHAGGDLVLKHAAAKLKEAVRPSDMVARMGGDEFIVAVFGISNIMDLQSLGSRMLASLAHPLQIQTHTMQAHASIGIAVFPQDGRTLDELLKHADLAAYRSKQSGRGTATFFTDDIQDVLVRRANQLEELRSAI